MVFQGRFWPRGLWRPRGLGFKRQTTRNGLTYHVLLTGEELAKNGAHIVSSFHVNIRELHIKKTSESNTNIESASSCLQKYWYVRSKVLLASFCCMCVYYCLYMTPSTITFESSPVEHRYPRRCDNCRNPLNLCLEIIGSSCIVTKSVQDTGWRLDSI